jgi:putative membrane protein
MLAPLRPIALTALLVAVLAGCDGYHSRHRNDAAYRDRDRPAYGADQRGMNNPRRDRAAWPETRILSILHASNQEEIATGNLAMQRGESRAVRNYGEMLVDHHRQMDAEVMDVASQLGVQLMSGEDVRRLKARERNMPVQPDAVADLSRVQPDMFDRAFAQRMVSGHAEVIALAEQARREDIHPRVRELIERALPRLREHEDEARDLLR